MDTEPHPSRHQGAQGLRTHGNVGGQGRSTQTRLVFRVLLIALAITLGAVNLYGSYLTAFDSRLLDVGVFRDAGNAFRHGHPLYDGFPSRSGYAFIYPPFAAVLFLPLTVGGELFMDIVWNATIIACVVGILAMACHRLGMKDWLFWAVTLGGFATCLDIIQANLYFGQINVFLVFLVTADVLGYTPKPLRGLGIGLAAGVKITPAAYAIIFLVRKDWWSLGRSAGFFFITVILGFFARASESVDFWTKYFFETDRGGRVDCPHNQGLGGLLSRGPLSVDAVGTLTPFIFVAFAAATIYVAYQLEKHNRSVEALFLVVLGISIGGPYAVAHHWAGAILVLPIILAVREDFLRILLSITAGAWIVPGYMLIPESDPSNVEWRTWLAGNLIGLMGLTVFIVYLIYTASPEWRLQEPPQKAGGTKTDSSADPGTDARTTGPAAGVIHTEETGASELNR